MSGRTIVRPAGDPVPVSDEAKQRIRDRKRAWNEGQAEIRKRCPGWYESPPRSLEGMKPNLVYVVGGMCEFPMGELVFLQCSSCDYEACEDADMIMRKTRTNCRSKGGQQDACNH